MNSRFLSFFLFAIAMVTFQGEMKSQNDLYYPPVDGEWESVSPMELGWCGDSIPALINFLDDVDSKAFIVLKDGKIVIEEYFDEFTADSVWYWASAGKSLRAFLAGKMQGEGLLTLDDPVGAYLGQGWSSLETDQELAITVRHLLTMTSGLDDGVDNPDCDLPECLLYLEEPGERWAYHNGAYNLFNDVLSNAAGYSLNLYIFNNLTMTAGISGLYLDLDFNSVFFSTPRSMARFGLLCQGHGVWNDQDLLQNPGYFEDMTTTSQSLNEAYGYLWWLNNSDSFMVPNLQFVFPGQIMPNAPQNVYNAIGRNGQYISIDEEGGLVWIRMGESNGDSLVPTQLGDDVWSYLNQIVCTADNISEDERGVVEAYPNPIQDYLQIELQESAEVRVIGLDGSTLIHENLISGRHRLDLISLQNGIYILEANFTDTNSCRMIKSKYFLKHVALYSLLTTIDTID
ncbi:MAG: serine hydrolase, partial [Flavobacteriales bacterium]|nr:serine hydrolase [Flavobacteriales bacterium]